MRKLKLALTVVSLLLATNVFAQKFAISTNIVDWGFLGTMNIEADYAVHRHVSLNADVRINPWVFRKGDEQKQFQNKMQTYAVGVRWWPWYIYSGFWAGAKLQYMEYDCGGIFKRFNEKGDAYGLGLSLGYMFIISPEFNINLGLGGWGGYRKYKRYEWTCCGPEIESGNKMFFWPNELLLSFVYVF